MGNGEMEKTTTEKNSIWSDEGRIEKFLYQTNLLC